jgi:hypothetical protein
MLTSPSGKRPTVTLPKGFPTWVAISAARSGLALPEKMVMDAYSGLLSASHEAMAAAAPATPKSAAADMAAPAPDPEPSEAAAARKPVEPHLLVTAAKRDTVALARDSMEGATRRPGKRCGRLQCALAESLLNRIS